MNWIPAIPVIRLCATALLAAVSATAVCAEDRPAESEPRAKLIALADNPRMYLGTGPDSASDHFGIACRYMGRRDGKEWAWDLWTVCDGKRVVTLVRTGRDSNKMYTRAVVADGVAACLDTRNPGGLVVTSGGWPSVRIRAVADEFQLSFGSANAGPEVVFDPASIIRCALAKARETKTGTEGRLIVRTERAALGVIPTPEGVEVPCPVVQLEFPGPDAALVVGVFKRRAAEKVAGLRPLTLEGVKGLGVPMRGPEPGELARLLSPGFEDVETNPRFVAVSAKLSGLPRDADYRFPPEDKGGEPKR